MESVTNPPNKFSIGKYLRKKKGIYQRDNQAKIIPLPESLQKYVDYLKENGAQMDKLDYAEFKLKNGLPYPGLIANQKIITDEIIVRIPRQLILSTRKAFFSDVRQVFFDNPKFFSPYLSTNWEDRMLLVFLLHEYQKRATSEWFHLLSNLPRDIDYIVFWKDKELDLLEDKTLVKGAKRRRKQYDYEEDFLVDLGNRYPGLLDPSIFVAENIRWIYTHLITRCFGKYLEYVEMVPFAELFNHECSDVYYDLEYHEKNPTKPSDYEMETAQEIADEAIQNFETTEGSYHSEDFEFDSDFEDDEDIKKEEKYYQIFKEDEENWMFSGAIGSKIKEIEEYLIDEFNWADGFCLFFVKGIYNEAQSILASYIAKKITLNSAKNSLKVIETSMQLFKEKVAKFYKDFFDIDEKNIFIKQKENLQKMAADEEKSQQKTKEDEKALFNPDDEWKEDTFDNFVMKASWRDQFEKGSQVFFCYGRLSNRLLLLRYGVSLEYNKYEHIHFKIPYLRHFKDTPWILEKIKAFRLSKYMRFKLKRTCLNVNFINFCKGLLITFKRHDYAALVTQNNLDIEIKAITKACELLEELMASFSKTKEEYQSIRDNPKTDYHTYFAVVFCLERLRLIMFHLKAMNVLKVVLEKIEDGQSVIEASCRVEELETEEEYYRNRFFLKSYFKRLHSIGEFL